MPVPSAAPHQTGAPDPLPGNYNALAADYMQLLRSKKTHLHQAAAGAGNVLFTS